MEMRVTSISLSERIVDAFCWFVMPVFLSIYMYKRGGMSRIAAGMKPL